MDNFRPYLVSAKTHLANIVFFSLLISAYEVKEGFIVETFRNLCEF